MRRLLTAAGLLALAATGCDTAAIDTADASPPTVEIKVRQADNQYAPASTAVLTDQLSLAAIAEDPNGVRSLRIDFLGSVSDTCTVGSSVYSGSFGLPLPQPMEQQLQGNEDGEVLTKLPLFADLPGNLTCTAQGQQGRPIGHVITVRATATNWGNGGPVTDELKVTVQ